MDKQYNVDDILSEIKSRKARERGGQDPKPAPKENKTDKFMREFRFESAQEPEKNAPPPERERVAGDTGEFHFNIPPVQPEKPRNPLDFEGRALSIADKAKLRGRDLPGFASPRRETTEHPDFSGFRAPSGDDSEEHTRVLPRVGFSRELDLEDVRKMNFGGARRKEPAYEEYDDEDGGASDEAPGKPAVDFSEYNSVEDRKDVATDIARIKLWLFIRCGLTAVLTLVLFYLAFAGPYVMWLPQVIDPVLNTRMYLLTTAVLTVLVAFVNSSPMGGGIIGLCKMRANSDSLAALAMLGVVAQSAVWVNHYDRVNIEQLSLYCSVAALIMLFNALGKFAVIHRIQQNFRIISSDKPKKAVLAAQPEGFCREFAREAQRRKPVVAFSARAGFLTDFLALSYSDKYDVGVHRVLAPVCLAGGLVVCAITHILKGDPIETAGALAAVLCMCATFSSTFIENIPLGKLTRKIAPQGGMVSGNKAVEDYCDTAAVVLSETDLFPAGCVNLLGIHASSRGRVDEAILDAASVLCSIDCALSPLFLDMIGGDKRLLKKVDNVVYENGMGVSAWVDARRILIGNRGLMLNHGIVLPAESAENKQDGAKGEAIYLSCSGEMSARFVVSYKIDEDMAMQLDALAALEKTLVVYTVNPHFTQKKLWELYGYPQDLCRVMPAERHAEYLDMARPRENAIAEIAYTGKAHTMVAALVACVKARSSILSATAVQMFQIAFGYALVTFLAFMGSVGTLTLAEICVFQLFWFLVIFILQQMKSS